MPRLALAAVSLMDLLDITTFNLEVIKTNLIPSFLDGNMCAGNAIHLMENELLRDMDI